MLSTARPEKRNLLACEHIFTIFACYWCFVSMKPCALSEFAPDLLKLHWKPPKRRTSEKVLTKRHAGILQKIQFNPKNCASFCGICRKYFRNARDPTAGLCSQKQQSIINGENLLAICCLAPTTIRLNCIKQMCCSIVVFNANFLIKIFEQCESPEGGDERSPSL